MDFALLDHLSVSVFVLERRGPGQYRLLFLNRANMALTGIDRDIASGKDLYDIFPTRLAEQMADNFEAAYAASGPYAYRELLPLPVQDLWFDTSVTRASIDGRDCLVGTAIDVTATVTAEANRTLADVEVHEEREQFIALAAHDMLAPGREIRDVTRKLREGFVDHGDGKAGMIDRVDVLARQMIARTDNVIHYVAAAERRAEIRRIDPGRLSREILASLDPNGIHQLTVTPGQLETDISVLQLVLHHLLSDSVEQSGAASLSLALDISAPEPGRIRLDYSDDRARNTAGTEGASAPANGINAAPPEYGLRIVSRLLRARGGDITRAPSCFGSGSGWQLNVLGSLKSQAAEA